MPRYICELRLPEKNPKANAPFGETSTSLLEAKSRSPGRMLWKTVLVAPLAFKPRIIMTTNQATSDEFISETIICRLPDAVVGNLRKCFTAIKTERSASNSGFCNLNVAAPWR